MGSGSGGLRFRLNDLSTRCGTISDESGCLTCFLGTTHKRDPLGLMLYRYHHEILNTF